MVRVPRRRARARRRRNKTGHWNPSSLSGNIERGAGILNNRAYIGERIFNRRRWVEVPNDRRDFSRQPRLDDEAEWMDGEDPSSALSNRICGIA